MQLNLGFSSHEPNVETGSEAIRLLMRNLTSMSTTTKSSNNFSSSNTNNFACN